jgi:DNA repair exonuclease SbcCD ATPase subunit
VRALKPSVASLSLIVASIDARTIAGWLSANSETAGQDLATAWRNCQEAERAAEAEREKAELDYSNFARVKEEAFNLAQQLRGIARSILNIRANENECPLCHTVFAPGELSKHIEEGIDPNLERAGQELFKQTVDATAALDRVRASKGHLSQLVELSTQLHHPVVSVQGAFDAFLECQQRLDELQADAVDADARMQALDAQGLSYARHLAIGNELAAQGCLLSEFSLSTIDGLLKFYNNEAVTRRVELEALAKTEAQYAATLRESIPSVQAVIDGRAWLSQYKEQVTVTRAVETRLLPFVDAFPWPRDEPLSEYLISVNSVRSVAADLLTLRNVEARKVATHAATLARKASLEFQIEALEPRLGRFNEAHAALDLLIDQYPLSGAVEKALDSNKAAIESIFARIHSPDEFSGFGSGFSTLRRKSGDEATLNEVSTGQRAALALSIFLAQNSQLASGPPVVLIDDPIAHVDDLNCLSFLDYLREMVIDGRRQIFFATANDKVASLIQRKFDFLGDDFTRIRLTREV